MVLSVYFSLNLYSLSIQLFFFTDLEITELIGYVHSVSPEKVSNDGKKRYIEFKMQTGRKSYKRAVCFDKGLMSDISQFASDHSPLKIRNRSEMGTDIILTKRTKLEETNNSDVDCEYCALPEDSNNEKNIVHLDYVTDAKSYPEGSLVGVKGKFIQTSTELKEVPYGSKVSCLSEKCALFDNSGWIPLTIWQAHFDSFEHGKIYAVGPLQVKEFGTKYLSTTSKTTSKEIDDAFLLEDSSEVEEMIAEAMGSRTKRSEKFSFAGNFSVAYLCRKCQRKITDVIALNIMNCPSVSCKAVQRTKDCSQTATKRVAFEEGGSTFWLTVKDRMLQKMLGAIKNKIGFDGEISLKSSETDIYTHVLSAEDFEVKFDANTHLLQKFTLL